MGELNITSGGQSFPHLLYHFVLTYSNPEDVTLCYSESFESLSDGLQNALWELGCVPLHHRTDRMSLAVNNASDEREFTGLYGALLRHYNNDGAEDSAAQGERERRRIFGTQPPDWRTARSAARRRDRGLRGRGKHRVDYRHIIHWLVRKPGAFENYRYRDELFPPSRFRMIRVEIEGMPSRSTPNVPMVTPATAMKRFGWREDKKRMKLLRSLVLAVLVTAAGNAQVAVAAGDVGNGLSRAGLELARGAVCPGTGIATAAPDILASGKTLAFQLAAVGWGTGRIMIPPVAGAARDISFALARAGWHLIPRRDNDKPRSDAK
jgi:hypothetical protein